MSDILEDRLYTPSHEWVQIEGDVAVVGISDYAQAALGDIVFLELPGVNETVEAGDTVATLESVKAASDVYSPISGEIIDVNADLVDNPGLINSQPYFSWLFKVKMSNAAEVDDLLTSKVYEDFV